MADADETLPTDVEETPVPDVEESEAPEAEPEPLAPETSSEPPAPKEDVTQVSIEIPADETELLGVEECDKLAYSKPDAENTEFLYYSTTLREIAPRLTNEVDRHLVIPWIRKLFRPQYHVVRFRSKRNKYLLHLVLLLMNDEAWGIFRDSPPEGDLKDPDTIAHKELQWKAEWEMDTMWLEVLQELPAGLNRMECSIHRNLAACKQDREHSKQLDDEFAYLLYLTRPYCVLLRNSTERTTAASWLQTLCTIRPDACSAMKRIRNEYCMALLGYVHELRSAGPFSLPPWNPLPPLADMVRILAERRPIIDPCSYEANEFLGHQPIPEEGAFCYLAITGELLDTSLNELD